jgi:hypothetical protein
MLFKYSGARGPDLEALQQSIRLVLWTFVILAQKFDRAQDNIRYAANVMLFRVPSSLPPEKKDSLRGRLCFCDPEVSVDNLLGVLDLCCQLSATSDSAQAEPDPHLSPMALPIPRRDHPDYILPGEAAYRSRLLPGAPRAFHTKSMGCYLDVSKIAEWCRQKGDFSPGIQQQIDEYFRNHQMGSFVRSFVSLPLQRPQSDEILGVLNLHRSEIGMLGAETLARQFVHVVRPNVLTLERLLVAVESRV